MCKLFYLMRVCFDLENTQKLERVVVLLSLLEYHLVVPNSQEGHPYKWLGQAIPNHCHSEYGILQYINGTSKQRGLGASARM